MIAGLAFERRYPLADYHAALIDADGLLPTALSEDGIHPNTAGYDRMTPILIKTVEALGLGLPPTDTRP